MTAKERKTIPSFLAAMQRWLVLFKLFFRSREVFLLVLINPFAPEPPVTARADPGPFYPL